MARKQLTEAELANIGATREAWDRVQDSMSDAALISLHMTRANWEKSAREMFEREKPEPAPEKPDLPWRPSKTWW